MVRSLRITSIFTVIISAALVCACAPTSTATIGRSLSSTSNVATASSVTSATTVTSSGTTTTTTTNTVTTVPTGSSAPMSLRVGTTGYNSTTVTVQTGTVLKVKFTPGIQDQAIAGTSVYPQYSQLGVYITVNGIMGATQMLSNGLYSGQAQTSSVLDFSNAVSTACAGNTACRQTVTITIDHPNNDYWCVNYGEYCPWSWVYQTHPWHGTLTIETDDTTAI